MGSCTYEYSIYNVRIKKSSEYRKVKIKKADHVDKLGCSLCREDQKLVVLKNRVSFLICHKLAKKVEKVLNSALDRGFPIKEVIGYRPQKSRGRLDENGNRTEFSNHSFGTAIDINPNANGLYENCFRWGTHCRLRRGGLWLPGENPFSIPRDSPLIKAMAKIGLKWGGRLFGQQKDFMHFSLYGN
jgi:hypothetical protein